MATVAQTAIVVVDTSVAVAYRQSLATSSAPAALQAVAAEVAMPVAVVKLAMHSVAMVSYASDAMVPVANAMAAKDTAANKTAERKTTPPDAATCIAFVFSELASSSQADRSRRPACPC